jgi:hypothetical protein
MQCEGCDCTDDRACFDEATGEGCYWVRPGLCSVCARALEEIGAGALIEDPDPDPPRVQLVGEHEGQRFIERRRGA